MGKIVGIDYGLKRIGLAISDEYQRTAFGRSTIETADVFQAVRVIKELCTEERVEKIIVGWPKPLRNETKDLPDELKEFNQMLKKQCNLPIELEDERLTTQLAQKQLHERPGKKKRADRDRLAAVAILQSYLDRIPIQR